MSRTHAFSLLPFICCLLAGCSKLVPAEGTVTIDGKPLVGASLVFYPEGSEAGERGGPHQANAVTDEAGRFVLRTINKEGAWPRSYKVTVSKRELPPDMQAQLVPGASAKQSPPRLDPKLLEQQKNLPPNMPNPTTMGPQVNLGNYMKETLPEVYVSLQTTPLRIEIPKKGTKEANLDLKSKP